ncbi:MAG: hypothetical protein J5985_08485 [Kiritimatiellae bacterium]|nr:hypothetical protein [Kiritimatiellia bacterium]
MTLAEVNRLTKRFGAPGRIGFRMDGRGLPVAVLACKFGYAEVSLYGARVLTYKPTGHAPVLFLGKDAAPVSPSAAPTLPPGGIAPCWPWFGPAAEGSGGIEHGFARREEWSVVSTSYSDDVTELSLGLVDSPETKAFFPYSFALMLHVTLGMSFKVELTARNAGIAPMTLTEGLLPCFRVMRIEEVRLEEVDGAAVENRLTGEKSRQEGGLVVEKEHDALYFPRRAYVCLVDQTLRRKIDLLFTGAKSVAVWNPGEGASGGFAEGENRQMLCVGPVNAPGHPVKLKPGEKHTLGMTVQSKLL